MTEKYKDKYRVKSARLNGWDYSFSGAYFITICTKNREHYFGEIDNGKMVLSTMGVIANKYWKKIPEHFHFVQLDEYIIMPNHVHGIIVINNNIPIVSVPVSVPVETPNLGVSTIANAIPDVSVHGSVSVKTPIVETPKLGVSTNNNTNINTNANWKSGSLGVIINQYKRICTSTIKNQGDFFAWQSRFYDRIIRNDGELNRVREYIINNPAEWENDENNIDMMHPVVINKECGLIKR